jgi:hypothetical protein
MHATAPVSHKEIEIKLEVAPATLLTLKKIPLFQTIKAAPKRASQVSVYFDAGGRWRSSCRSIAPYRRPGDTAGWIRAQAVIVVKASVAYLREEAFRRGVINIPVPRWSSRASE